MRKWGSRRGWRLILLMLAVSSVAMPKPVQAKFDPRDPLGVMRSKARAVSIEVAPGNWGRADPGDIRTLLESVAREFLQYAPGFRNDLVLRVVPRSDAPRVLYERGVGGEYIIQLTARDQRWFQYAYQFAHELCHIASNFDHKEVTGDGVAQGNQWFEEALCETASLFTLKRLAASWESNPPRRDWAGYGEAFAAYARTLLSEPHRQLEKNESLGDWYAEHADSLREDPYLREKNEVVATALLPLFEGQPQFWQAITHLNPSRASAGKTFGDYLADWYATCPDKALPAEVMRRFGFDPDRPPSARASANVKVQELVDVATPRDLGASGPIGE
ncbi:MAG: hypothetical protein H6948_03920 [Zoogloeaceae bacterium]|nr:hypothetical protein [Rhodocyclaceae bacterium]MCP5231233.1 hypothetical protein [Zoogloeaceae bacterium]MCP5241429.1 hypothetical protein [Zoogloeaceae bacterium]MCW5614026.1 hypothetical protein [Rhodocyclaceae bacterium]